MGHYGWAGPGAMRKLDFDRKKAPKITEPQGVDVPGSGLEKSRLFICSDCGKKFKKAMIMARHFNSNHTELREDKDSWRAYSKEVWD